jgi:hypothetical protein
MPEGVNSAHSGDGQGHGEPQHRAMIVRDFRIISPLCP